MTVRLVAAGGIPVHRLVIVAKRLEGTVERLPMVTDMLSKFEIFFNASRPLVTRKPKAEPDAYEITTQIVSSSEADIPLFAESPTLGKIHQVPFVSSEKNVKPIVRSFHGADEADSFI